MNGDTAAQETTALLSQYFQGRAKFRQWLLDHFNESELKDLTYDLAIEYDRLPGSGTGDKSRELIAYCERLGRTPDLFEACRRARPRLFPAFEDELSELLSPADLRKAAQLNVTLQAQLREDEYGAQSLARLAGRPEKQSRQAMFAALLGEMMADDPILAQKLQALLREGKSSGDTINQQLSVSGSAQTGDINVIGKIDGDVDLDELLGR